MTSRRLYLLSLTLVVIAFAAIQGDWDLPDAGADDRLPSAPAPAAVAVAGTVTVGAQVVGHPIRPGFIGFSIEYPAVTGYAGAASQPLDPLFVRLVRSVAPRPVLRIGGDTTDSTWWPVRGERRPPSVSFTITRPWLRRLRTLTQALDAKLILGVNLKSGSLALARAEGQAFRANLGSRLAALELGNEPSNYAHFAAYRLGRRAFFARPRTYAFRSYLREFDRVGRALPGVPLAGPALGTSGWLSQLRRFIRTEPRASIITTHRYPLSCFAVPGSAQFASANNLLGALSTDGLASETQPYIAAAHAAGRQFRLDELNSVSCGGRIGVSNSFASTLWLVDSLFELARAGVDGVNIHTFPGAAYAAFSFRWTRGRWTASVKPPFLGLLMFTRAAPPGARLLPTGSTVTGVQTWATRTPSGGTRVVMINDRPGTALTVSVAGLHATQRVRLERLTAPSLAATSGIKLNGQRFASRSADAQPIGAPQHLSIAPVAGRYTVSLPAASATLLTTDG